jgi:hypothetical protein
MTKIDDLIETLVSDLAPIGRQALRLRLACVIVLGITGAVVALLTSLPFRPHLHHVTLAAFWVKFLYTASLMAVTIVALDRVARPEGSIVALVRVSVVAFSIMLLLSLAQIGTSPVTSYLGLIFGYSASFCPFLILAFGLPAFVANMWFLRRAAPMDPGIAGFVAGACGGAIGGWVYSLACIENGMPFIAIWYTLGVLLSGLLGTLVGKLVLHW